MMEIDVKDKDKEIAHFWERQASRSEIVACVKEIAHFWERQASRSEIVDWVTELVSQNQRLIDKVKELTSIQDGLWFRLEDLIAKTKDIVDDKDLESEFATMVGNKSQKVEEIIDSLDELTMPAPPLDDFPLSQGEIEIAITPPVDMVQIIRFRRNLQGIRGLNISGTSSHRNGGGVLFTVLITEPLPLVSLLKEIPDVEQAESWAGEEDDDTRFAWESTPDFMPQGCQGTVVVTLNHSEV